MVSNGFGDNDSDLDKFLQIFSIGTSFMSLMYGMASYNLYQLYRKEIELSKVFKFLLANLIGQMVVSLLPLSSICCWTTLMLGNKMRKLNSTDEIKLFENNQTREFLKFNQDEVIVLSLDYIFLNLLVAISIIVLVELGLAKETEQNFVSCVIRSTKKTLRNIIDLNNIANPMNIVYRKIRKSINVLREHTIAAQFYHSSILMLFSGISVYEVIMQKLEECNGSNELCTFFMDEMFRFGIFQGLCFIIGLVGQVLWIVEFCGEKYGMPFYKNFKIQTLSTEATQGNDEDVEMQPLTSIGDT